MGQWRHSAARQTNTRRPLSLLKPTWQQLAPWQKALSCLVVARWGLHWSNSAEGCPFPSPQADMAGIPLQGVTFLGPAGARWGAFGHLTNAISGLRRCRWAVIWDGIQYLAINWQYPVADRAEMLGSGTRFAKYGARTMKFMCF